MLQFLTPWKYQFDEFGTNPANLIVGEIHTLAANHIPIPLFEGLFYNESVIIKPQGTPTAWTVGVHYTFVGLDDYITARTGKPVSVAVEVVDKNWTGPLEITYQCVGGAEGMPIGAVRELLEAIQTAVANPSIDWNTDIDNLPTYFPPGLHGHPLESMEQLDLLTQAFREVFNALINRIPMHQTGQHLQEQIDRMLQVVAEMRNSINQVVAVQGSTNQIEELMAQLQQFETVASYEKTLNAGQSSLIGEWDLNQVNAVRGMLTFIGGSEFETFDFLAGGTALIAPKVSYFGAIRTSSQIMSITATRVGSTLRLTVSPGLAGRVKSKLYGVL